MEINGIMLHFNGKREPYMLELLHDKGKALLLDNIHIQLSFVSSIQSVCILQ